MATAKQVNANRENATRSTGPRTSEGKARVKYNAVRHGLLAEAALLPGEDEALFRAFSDAMIKDLSPVGEVESLLSERVINISWRLRRLSHVEAGLFVYDQAVNAEERHRADARAVELHVEEWWAEQSVLTSRQPLRILDQDIHDEACVQAERAAALQRTPPAALGAAFALDAATDNAFPKLSRYETALSRDLERTMRQLAELQHARQVSGTAGK